MPERQKTMGLCRACWRQVAIPVLCYLKHGRVSQTKPPFFSSVPTPDCEWVRALPLENESAPSAFVLPVGSCERGKEQRSLAGSSSCIPLPSLHSSSSHTVYREFSQITAALLPPWINAVQHLQGEKWDSKYEFPQQWQHKAIGRGTVNDSTSGQPPGLSAVLCCTRPLARWQSLCRIPGTTSPSSTVVWFSACCSWTNSK